MRSAEVTASAAPRVGALRSAALRTAAGLLVGAIFAATFARLVNLGAVLHRLAHLRIGFALGCGGAFLAAYAVRGIRWRLLLRPMRITIRRAIAIYEIATFLNWLLPLQGGELAKSLLLRKTNAIPVSRSLATVSMDKTMDLLPAVGLLALLPFVHLHLSRWLWVLLLAALTVITSVVALVGLVAYRRQQAVALISHSVSFVLPGRLSARVEPFVALFVDTLVALMRRPRILGYATLLTGCAVCLDALFCLFAFKAVGVSVEWPVALYGYTFFNLGFILPTPPGHIGTNELMGLLIFSGGFGVSRSGVGAMFLFSHPWTAILMTASGLGCLSAMGLTLRGTWRLTHDTRELETE